MILFFIILLLSILLVLGAFAIVVQLTSLYLRIYFLAQFVHQMTRVLKPKSMHDSYSASVSSLSLSSFAKSSALSPDVSAFTSFLFI